jgi:RNA polymerase sigma factor (sigma-70 family)
MSDIPESNRGDASLRRLGSAMTAAEMREWFVREVLPLEFALMQFLQHNWRNRSDVEDLLQDVYVRVCEAALKQRPDSPRAFVFATARNLLIDHVRHARVIPIEMADDLDAFGIADDEPGPERSAGAREELRRLSAALDRLPPRCREVVVLRRVEGLSRARIASRLGIAEATVAEHLAKGMSTLADILYGQPREGIGR